MWFLGLVIGAILGSMAGGAGLLLGALLGAFAGWAIKHRGASADADRLERIESALRQLESRVRAMERAHASPTTTDAAPLPGADAPPAPTADLRLADLTPAGDEAALAGAARVAETAPDAAPDSGVPASAAAPRDPGAAPSLQAALARPRTHRAAAADVAEEMPVSAPSHDREDTSPEAPAEQQAPPGAPAGAWLARLFQGNIVAKFGVLILFFGVGFLLKYAYDHAMLPVPLRLAGVAAVAFGMLYVGWRLLDTRRLYGLILQGGGIGLLYLDVFFALRVYNLVGPTIAFAAFMALGVAATLLAVRQDAKVLAVLGLTGAFLAPVIAGSQTGSHVLLFSYYTLLNGFILAVSWFKAWRDLNLVGFVFTFIVGYAWGANVYRPELFATVEPFLLIFFAMYLVIPILFAQRQPPELKGLVDGTLVFGTPLCAAFMQAALVKDMPHGLAWSAGVASALYAVLAAMTVRRAGMRLLGETYVALAAVFLTLAIFFAFDAYPTFALWTLEGAAIFWVGLRQRRLLARLFGLVLQLAGTAYFLMKYPTYELSNPWWNAFVAGGIIIAAAGFIIARLVHKNRDVMDAALEPGESAMLVWAAAWWSIAGAHALYHAYAWPEFLCGLLAFAALTVVAVELIGAGLQWPGLRKIAMAHLPALVAIALMTAFGDQARLHFVRPLTDGGYWAWPLNFLVFFWIHARQVRDGLVRADSVLYHGAWLLVAAIATWDALWLIGVDRYAESLAWGGAGIAAGYVRFRLRECGRAGALPIAAAVLVWGVVFWFISGFGWIEHTLETSVRPMAMLGFVVVSCLAFEACGALAQWTPLRRVAALLPAGMVLALFLQVARGVHPFAAYGWLTWPCAVALLYIVLRRQEEDRVALFTPAQHAVGFWIAVTVLTWEAEWQLRTAGFGKAWVTAVCAVIPAAAVGWMSGFSARSSWPFGVHYRTTYGAAALVPIVAYLGLWMLYANLVAPGSTKPLPYLPILNPLDVAHLAVFAALWRWSRTFPEQEVSTSMNVPLFAALGFLWVNCVLLRTVHYWAGVEYEWDALAHSVLVQSGFSLLWTATAFVLMLYATRQRRRQLWMVGAALLGVVVIKLFLNDLSNTGTVARIVSFIGVGAGLLVIGYAAPVPPGDREVQRD